MLGSAMRLWRVKYSANPHDRPAMAAAPIADPATGEVLIERNQVTFFAGVPTMYAALLNCPERHDFDLSSLRLCVSGGAALPLEILSAFEKEFGSPIIEGYGLSETSPVACFSRVDLERKPGSIGVPIKDDEMRVVDEDGNEVKTGNVGEIQVKGPNVMKGYWNLPDATAAAITPEGWFATGDMGKKDDDGYFFIVDRKKEMIIRGGYNVYPREIEEVLYEHPAVNEAAVIGVPHPELGEEVVAVVSLKEGQSATAEDIRDFCKERLAPYKVPSLVEFRTELPKSQVGKTLRRILVEEEKRKVALH